MEILALVLIVVAVSFLSVFNYYLNLAPGADPDDFRIGPPQLNLTCDCYLNPLILGGILVIALSAGSGMFQTRPELFLTGIISFAVVTVAGVIGRRRRYNEWKDFDSVVRRAIPKASLMTQYRSPVDILFDDEEEDEDEDDYDFEDY